MIKLVARAALAAFAFSGAAYAVDTTAPLSEHTATVRDKSFKFDLSARAKAKLMLTKAGTFEFYCRFHPGMVGTLTVATAV